MDSLWWQGSYRSILLPHRIGAFMNYIMPEELGQEILNYLVERPYKEVFTLVMKLQSMKPEEKPEVVAAET